jgi:hypothetical protein
MERKVRIRKKYEPARVTHKLENPDEYTSQDIEGMRPAYSTHVLDGPDEETSQDTE